ncbi:hypothetical protein SAMN04487944_114109 [Gracilibacillus ureilyticus]|uniref:RNA-binding protein KhpB N-terminal domain-containing protein n=1 Tax=Gracilibacillus ureilyticus TaxID=531814 RepID=A0A1H9TQW4_9BACI|nr:FapA family protein [Gracilibacillus ureilyticus]SER99043.1 hypothetical protein SAMN04487944_114109 [Gracilibacillus ureilyticus]
MNHIISKGKSVEEAVERGLLLMDAAREEVNIEIIQDSTGGFLGLRKKPAIVKISLSAKKNGEESNTQSEEPLLEEMIDSLEELSEPEVRPAPVNKSHSIGKNDAEIASVNNNRLYIKSDDSKHFATISIGEGISFFKNGQLISDKSVIVSPKDDYRLEYESYEEKPTSWTVVVSKDKLEAILEVKPGEVILRNLKNVPPGDHIALELEESVKPVNSLTREQIIEQLKNDNVTFGLNEKAIQHAIESKNNGKFVVAVGKEPKHGLDAELEVKVPVNTENGLVEDEHGNVNFRDTTIIPNVEVGTIIAILHPSIPGLPGMSVLGEELAAKQPKDLRVISGSGTNILEDKIISTESGRPVIEQRGRTVKAMIMAKLVHDGNVNLSSGNIRFSGDIDILGEVEENMTVEAGGDIFIHKAVSEAVLTASKSIITKGNVFNSNLTAGKHNLLIMELGHILRILDKHMDKMLQNIQQLTTAKAYKSNELLSKGLKPLIILLLEKKFRDFKTQAKRYVDIVGKAADFIEEPEWKTVAVELKALFLTLSNQVVSLDKLERLQELMKELASSTEADVEPNSYITLANVTNSKIYSSGNVTIIGKGCINSKVHSGGKLNISGILRGGEVYGRLGINVGEVGTVTGTKTVLSVPEDQSIIIMKAHEGTIIRIGDAIRPVVKETTFIKAKLDKEGQVVFG